MWNFVLQSTRIPHNFFFFLIPFGVSFFFLAGCENGCSRHGQCTLEDGEYKCVCIDGWSGFDCSIQLEMNCNDNIDNDNGKFIPYLFIFFSFLLAIVHCAQSTVHTRNRIVRVHNWILNGKEIEVSEKIVRNLQMKSDIQRVWISSNYKDVLKHMMHNCRTSHNEVEQIDTITQPVLHYLINEWYESMIAENVWIFVMREYH